MSGGFLPYDNCASSAYYLTQDLDTRIQLQYSGPIGSLSVNLVQNNTTVQYRQYSTTIWLFKLVLRIYKECEITRTANYCCVYYLDIVLLLCTWYVRYVCERKRTACEISETHQKRHQSDGGQLSCSKSRCTLSGVPAKRNITR